MAEEWGPGRLGRAASRLRLAARRGGRGETGILQAAFGQGLNPGLTTGVGIGGTVTGGAQVPFQDPVVAQYAREIANDSPTLHRHADPDAPLLASGRGLGGRR